MKTLNVDFSERSYPIYIGQGILDTPALYTPHIKGQQVLVVTNNTIAPLYLEKLTSALDGYSISISILADGEQHKKMATVELIFDQLLEERHNRTTTLIALGGGVIGDMTGFAAACYQRGVAFIQVPTTLLAQVDSSVGGKTGVNHPLGKNMIGAFHQPNAVIIDTDTLDTLPDKELSAGLAEVIKYGLIRDPGFFEWLEGNIERLLARDSEYLAEAVYRSCKNKAEVVEQDELESGVRATLNLGHTFGHAIEACQGYGNWLHGEAVSAGTMMAADLSRRMGWLSHGDVQRIKSLLAKCDLPTKPPSTMSPDDFMQKMILDKKVLDGKLRLVLLKSLGVACVRSGIDPVLLNETFSAFESR
ncbi:MAG: 3-dehydroquinate synthase [Pseudomonadales bacterium]|nr:3-dehydroquinate synthase [Pseudomonadales bacterium]